MNSFIKRNQKKILAVFSAGLMIAFALPSAMKGANDRRIVTVGFAGKTKVTSRELTEAHAQWELLKLRVRVKRPDPNTGMDTEVSLLVDQLGEGFGQSAGQFVGNIIQQFDANPELFYLLKREAEEMGTTVSNDQLQAIMRNAIFTSDESSSDFAERAEEAVHTLLLVKNSAERAGDVMKVSRPLRERSLAFRQEMSLNVVPFKASDYLPKLPAMSDQELSTKLAAHFEKYKNEEPTTRPANEWGFGYRVPNQAQIQSIEIPGDAIRQAVSAKITDLDARKYFFQNRTRFTADPSSRPATTRAAGTTQPTTGLASTLPLEVPKPPTFEEVEKKVYERLIDENVAKLTSDILSYLNSQMAADYTAFRAAVTDASKGPSTAPAVAETMLAKAPVTALGVPYGSYEYLKQLALSAQKKFGVLPTTNQDLGLRSEKQLSAGGEIAASSVQGFDLMTLFRMAGGNFQSFQAIQQFKQQIDPLIRFPTYATNFVAPLSNPAVEQAARNFRLRVLALYEPSPVMEGRSMGLSLSSTPSNNAFIFRVVAAEPAHPPRLEEIKDRVLADLKLVEAQKLALAEATAFLKAVPNPHKHLDAAAAAVNRKLITSNLFSPSQPLVEKLELPAGDSSGLFVEAAYKLLNSTLGDPQHPVGVIDFKPAATVFAAEINQIQPYWTPAELPAEQLTAGAQMDRQGDGLLRMRWFDPAEIRARSRYIPSQPPKKSALPSEDSPQTPINPLGAI